MSKILYIVRGIPGSGKTTFARTLSPFHYEADQYFMEDGEYKFDASKLNLAHKYCNEAVESALKASMTRVVVSNTFTTEKEVKPYLELAKKYGYMVISLIVENRHGGESEHNVPDEVITKMKNRFSVKL